jgi:hypothetical protein
VTGLIALSDMLAAESSRGRLSESFELARSLVPSCRATPRSAYDTLLTLRSRALAWWFAIIAAAPAEARCSARQTLS